MGLQSNKPVKPITSLKSISKSKSQSFNSQSLSDMYKTKGSGTGFLNRVRSQRPKRSSMSTRDLFKF